MKRPLTIAMITILTILFIYACGSTIRTANTSFVTITFGGSQGSATLHAKAATPWARFKYYLADAKLMPEAYAYIPSVVQAIVVTVTAADITTPIVGVANIGATDTVASVRIEVPNGSARQFTVDGIRGVNSTTYYRGTASADLNGTDVNLSVSMALVGPGFYVNFATGIDQPTTSGTSTTDPFQTVTYALTRTTGTDAIYVMPGTYPPPVAAAGETYPLQLKPSTAIVCLGTATSTVFTLGSLGTTAFYGNDLASIDNCVVRAGAPGGGGIAINDSIGGTPGQQSRLRVNGTTIELSGAPTGLPNIGAVLSNDSLLLESAVTGSAASGSIYGIQVQGGNPNIIGNTISNLPTGINLTSGAGNAIITNNIIESNSTGINVATTAKPTISLNSIRFGGTGIFVSAGSPAITGNDINNNVVGVDIELSSVSPVIQTNTLFCNTVTDLFTNMTNTLDLRNNSWDHDTSTAPSGPTVMISVNGAGGCAGGADVCYQGAQPLYLPSSAAVPGGCLLVP